MDEQELKNQISQVVDQWVSEVLKSRFMEKPQGQQQRSLWDKFKQGVTNWWWGAKGEKHNPYRWRNRFGDELGVSESFDPSVFTLHEYRAIRDIVESVEVQLNESEEEFDKLRLMRIIYSSAEVLKDKLFDVLKTRVSYSGPPPAVPKTKAAGTRVMTPSAEEKPDRPAPKANESDPGAESQSDRPARGKVATRAAKTKPLSAPTTDSVGSEADSPKKEKPAVEVGPSASDSRSEKEEQEATEQNENMFDYIQVKGKLKDFLVALRGEFPAVFGKEIGEKKQKEVEEWFKKKMKELADRSSKKMSSEERMNFFKDVVDSFVEGIGGIAETDRDKTKLLMSGYLKDGNIRKELLADRKKQGDKASDPPEEEQADESLGMESYIFDGEKRVSPETAIKRIEGFIENPMASQGISASDERVTRLKDWWNEEKGVIAEKSDKYEYIEQMLVSTDSYLNKIGLYLGKSPKFVKGLMTKHIQKKSSR